MLIDSHAHLTTSKYKDDRSEVIERSKENGIERIVEIGAVSGFEGNYLARDLAESDDIIYFTVGVHPHDASQMNRQEWDKLIDLVANHPKMVGIGETGLDFFYNHSAKSEQINSLIKHIGLAKELSKPIVIHDRDAHVDVMKVLKDERAFETTGEFHCFSGDVELAKAVVDMGWMVALGGVVTFPKAIETHEVAKHIPLEHMLLETDCPYLTPVPYRGKRNEPWYTKFVAEKIAELKGIDVEQVFEQTRNNAVRLFGLGL